MIWANIAAAVWTVLSPLVAPIAAWWKGRQDAKRAALYKEACDRAVALERQRQVSETRPEEVANILRRGGF